MFRVCKRMCTSRISYFFTVSIQRYDGLIIHSPSLAVFALIRTVPNLLRLLSCHFLLISYCCFYHALCVSPIRVPSSFCAFSYNVFVH